MAQATLTFSTSTALYAAVGSRTATEAIVGITRSSLGWLDMTVAGYGIVRIQGDYEDERALMEHAADDSLTGYALTRAIQSVDWLAGQLIVNL